MALPSSSRYGARIDWVALHSAEGARTVGSLYDFFNRNQHASSHGGADGYQLSDGWVPDERSAWTLLNGNPRSLNLELCAFARWTREQWLSEGWVDGVWNPRQMIRHAAAWLRAKCDKHGIPKRLLTSEQVGRGERGIIDHARYTYGTGDGNHTDVGSNFPWDVLFADLSGNVQQQPQEEDETMITEIPLPASKDTAAVRVWLDPRKECALVVAPTIKEVTPGVSQIIYLVGSYQWGSNKVGVGGNPVGPGSPPIKIGRDNPIAWVAPKGTVYADILYSTAAEGGRVICYA